MNLMRPDFTKKDDFLYPAYQRMRLPLRGVLDSATLNLEDHQFSYDTYKLYTQADALEKDLRDSYEYIASNDLSDAVIKINNLRKRLILLEG